MHGFFCLNLSFMAKAYTFERVLECSFPPACNSTLFCVGSITSYCSSGLRRDAASTTRQQPDGRPGLRIFVQVQMSLAQTPQVEVWSHWVRRLKDLEIRRISRKQLEVLKFTAKPRIDLNITAQYSLL